MCIQTARPLKAMPRQIWLHWLLWGATTEHGLPAAGGASRLGTPRAGLNTTKPHIWRPSAVQASAHSLPCSLMSFCHSMAMGMSPGYPASFPSVCGGGKERGAGEEGEKRRCRCGSPELRGEMISTSRIPKAGQKARGQLSWTSLTACSAPAAAHHGAPEPPNRALRGQVRLSFPSHLCFVKKIRLASLPQTPRHSQPLTTRAAV